MSVGHGTHLAVPEVIARQKALIVEVVLCAIGRNALAVHPNPRTLKAYIELSHLPGNGLQDTGRDKVPKCGDLVIRDMSVGHGTHLAVPEVIARQKVLIVEVVLCAIGRHALAVTPNPRKIKA